MILSTTADIDVLHDTAVENYNCSYRRRRPATVVVLDCCAMSMILCTIDPDTAKLCKIPMN